MKTSKEKMNDVEFSEGFNYVIMKYHSIGESGNESPFHKSDFLSPLIKVKCIRVGEYALGFMTHLGFELWLLKSDFFTSYLPPKWLIIERL